MTGRSTVLTVNYRNGQVLARAELVRADALDNLEDLGQSGDRDIEVVRDGPAVSRSPRARVWSRTSGGQFADADGRTSHAYDATCPV